MVSDFHRAVRQVNGKPLDKYFPAYNRWRILAPFEVTGTLLQVSARRPDLQLCTLCSRMSRLQLAYSCVHVSRRAQYDVNAKVKGGGLASQLDALRYGIARALEKQDPEFRHPLKAAMLLTRDNRSGACRHRLHADVLLLRPLPFAIFHRLLSWCYCRRCNAAAVATTCGLPSARLCEPLPAIDALLVLTRLASPPPLPRASPQQGRAEEVWAEEGPEEVHLG